MNEEKKELSQVMQDRLSKLEQIKEMGINPFAYDFDRTDMARDLIDSFREEEEKTARIAGRILSLRRMGKAAFAHVLDETDRIQIYVRKDKVGDEAFDLFKLIDIGDIVGVSGQVFKTRTGEISLLATEIILLTKNIRPLPVVKEVEEEGEKKTFDAFMDTEQRYRQRYVDLVVNRQVREVFVKRSQIITAMRTFLDSKGYLEVETPILQPIYGGAAARPFITHHNALDMPLYLRIADELYLKRLIVGGYEGVYEISKDFRNEGIDRTHNPEFTMMELYVAYKDYHFMMNLVEEMVTTIAEKVAGTLKISYQGTEVDLTPPWRRLPLYEALEQYTGMNLYGKDQAELQDVAKKLHIEIEESWGTGKILDEIFKEKVEPNLIQPTFICDYPVELSPLAKRHRDDPQLVERFEPFVVGREIGNSFSELNDPIDQRGRLESQLKAFQAGDEEAHQLDDDFIRALEYGMPPTAGLGMGIDRLVMLLTDSASIRDVIFFPTMRPELSP
jgi:lysyl-tRNA synthetase, class II